MSVVKPHTVGIVLAGGKSSRMGENKAFLEFQGEKFIDRMVRILSETGVDNIFVSGDFEKYQCIPDKILNKFEGPAAAISHCLEKIEKDCHALFVPIDMPFLTVDCLKVLMDSEDGSFFSGFPLPAFLKRTGRVEEGPKNVRELLIKLGARPIELPKKYEQDMLNINTQKEWREALKNETKNRRARVYIQD
mgnify:CR=1 FL=1